MILVHKGANWRCGIGGGTQIRGKPTRYNNIITQSFSFSNECRPSRRTNWKVGKNINNSRGIDQAIDNWHNDLTKIIFFIQVRILRMESKMKGG
jgi:hypothetical protein